MTASSGANLARAQVVLTSLVGSPINQFKSMDGLALTSILVDGGWMESHPMVDGWMESQWWMFANISAFMQVKLAVLVEEDRVRMQH